MANELSSTGIKTFILAGNATFTVENTATGGRFTYKVQAKALGEHPYFVKVLTGSDNDSDYTFVGTIFEDGGFFRSRKSRIGEDAPSLKAFAWLWSTVRTAESPNLRTVIVRHEGACCRCGRTLTTPESIDLGLGPECARKMGGAL